MANEALRKVERILNTILNGKKYTLYVINADGTIFELKPNFTLLSKQR